MIKHWSSNFVSVVDLHSSLSCHCVGIQVEPLCFRLAAPPSGPLSNALPPPARLVAARGRRQAGASGRRRAARRCALPFFVRGAGGQGAARGRAGSRACCCSERLSTQRV